MPGEERENGLAVRASRYGDVEEVQCRGEYILDMHGQRWFAGQIVILPDIRTDGNEGDEVAERNLRPMGAAGATVICGYHHQGMFLKPQFLQRLHKHADSLIGFVDASDLCRAPPPRRMADYIRFGEVYEHDVRSLLAEYVSSTPGNGERISLRFETVDRSGPGHDTELVFTNYHGSGVAGLFRQIKNCRDRKRAGLQFPVIVLGNVMFVGGDAAKHTDMCRERGGQVG